MGDVIKPKYPPLSVGGIDKLQEENEQLKAQLRRVTAERNVLKKRLDDIKKWGE